MPNAAADPNTLGDVLSKMQGLLGDVDGEWVTVGYALPFINIVYALQIKQMRLGSRRNLSALIEVLNQEAGITSFLPAQKFGKPLFGLTDPLELWTKTANAPQQYYTPARGPLDILPNIEPPGITPGSFSVRVSFAWMGNALTILPVNGPIDLKVYGRFNPPPLQKLEDVLVPYPAMSDVTALAAAALAGVERSNPAVLAGYELAATAGMDNIIADLIIQTQRNPRRVGKLASMGGGSWFWA